MMWYAGYAAAYIYLVASCGEPTFPDLDLDTSNGTGRSDLAIQSARRYDLMRSRLMPDVDGCVGP